MTGRPAALLAAVVLLAIGSPDGGAQLSAGALLNSALRGPRTAFSATQRTSVTLVGGHRATVAVRLRVDGRGASLREYLDGPARGTALLQVGTRLWARGAAGEWTRLPDSAESDPAAASSLIQANYRVAGLPAASVLGRRVVGLRIEPRRACNPSRRMWIDPATWVILRDEVYAPEGRVRSTTETISYREGAQSESIFRPPAKPSAHGLFGPSSFSPRPSRADVQSETGRPVCLPAYVPAGYRISLFGVMVTGSGRLMPVVRYTDGLSAFTVFQRGRGPGGRGNGPGGGEGRCVGESGIQQSVVAVTGGRSNYLLVGDLAESELKRVAQSLP